ncbi:LysR family transcriptional regulator [Undibacterium sp. SXout11W]|uniref:LysR family transcriptional regulator n=1 Tax=Undibacterium sp. SXout11W TaxID=3413050 RepID=UPI003BF1EA63
MDFDSITVFVKIVEVGSISKAARLMGMPKTTVSAKLAALEKRLKVSLIQRTTRQLHVTEAGKQFFQHCANAVREVEMGEAVLQSLQAKPSGVLKITTPVDIGHTVLPVITSAFLDKYPDVTVDLVITNQKIDLLQEGIDLAIRVGVLKDSTMIARHFFDLHNCLLAAPAYLKQLEKITRPQDLLNATFIGQKGIEKLKLIKDKLKVEIPLNCRVFANDVETAKSLAMNGVGIGWLPSFVTIDAIENGQLVSVLPEWKLEAAVAFHFVYPGHRYTSPNVHAFIQTALDVFPVGSL